MTIDHPVTAMHPALLRDMIKPKHQTPRRCVHCNIGVGWRPRGLCGPCYDDLEVRKSIPITSKYATRQYDHEPTMEELDAMIAEQMRCLPEWWNDSKANEGCL